MVNGESFAATKVVSGIPQGSVLGPCTIVADLYQWHYRNPTGCLLQANDILVYCQIRNAMGYIIVRDVLDRLEVLPKQQLTNNLSSLHYSSVEQSPMQPIFSKVCLFF